MARTPGDYWELFRPLDTITVVLIKKSGSHAQDVAPTRDLSHNLSHIPSQELGSPAGAPRLAILLKLNFLQFGAL